jgi:hypothetical protein
MNGIVITDLDLTIIGLIFGVIGVVGTYFGIAAWLDQRPPDKLTLELIDGSYGDVDLVNNAATPARFFHIAVRNGDKKRIVRNCYAYLLSLKAADSGKELVSQSFELKWRGYTSPNVSILPSQYRKFDAFWVFKAHPEVFLVNAFLDSSALFPNARGTRTYRATYKVIAENFKPKEATFDLHLDGDLQKVVIEPVAA